MTLVAGDEGGVLARLQLLLRRDIREPVSLAIDDQTLAISATFSPVLTAPEQATFNDLVTMAKFGIPTTISLIEFQAIKSDLATARTYVGLASPTAAQTTAALKSTIRVIGALLRQ